MQLPQPQAVFAVQSCAVLSCNVGISGWRLVHAGTGNCWLKLPCRLSKPMHSTYGQARSKLRPSWQPAAVPSSGRSCRPGSAGLSGVACSGTASALPLLLAGEQRWQLVRHESLMPTFPLCCPLLSSLAYASCMEHECKHDEQTVSFFVVESG